MKQGWQVSKYWEEGCARGAEQQTWPKKLAREDEDVSRLSDPAAFRAAIRELIAMQPPALRSNRPARPHAH